MFQAVSSTGPCDNIKFTITGANVDQYKDKLGAGQIAMLKKYPTFKLNVYPTRRSASYPEKIYQATRAHATTATLVDNGNGIDKTIVGIPFPIPANGLEAIWNHIVRYRGPAVKRWINQAAVTAKFKTIEGNTNGKGERDSETGDVFWGKERAPSLKKCSIRIFTD